MKKGPSLGTARGVWWDGKFQVYLCDKRDSFDFSITRMSDKSTNVPHLA